MSPLPLRPLSEVSVDFGYIATGEQKMVIIDNYSRYLCIEIIDSTDGETVIPKLDSIIVMRGIPNVVKTDNGPPFRGYEFCKYAETSGFIHRKITPLWPPANSEVERFMRTLKKSVNASLAFYLDYKKELRHFLLTYRATPHSRTKSPPATLMFGTSVCSRLLEISTQSDDDELRA